MRTVAVLGAGIAGLLAARVLAGHADEVVVVERDDLGGSMGVDTGASAVAAGAAISGSGEGPRRGVPQGTQMHALLEAGRRGIEHLLPGFTDEFVAAGAVRANTGTDVFGYLDGQRKALVGDLPMVSATRPFLEAHVRRRVLAYPGVRVEAATVRGLSFRGERVDGVRLARGADETAETLHADLVVDATGRGSRVSAWLAEAGWPEPPLRRIAVDLGYATAVFRAPGIDPSAVTDGATLAQSLTTLPDGRVRVGTLGRIEGDRWIALMAGYADDKPTRAPDDFLARCREDPGEAFGKLAANAQLDGDVAVYRHPDNRRRDFHRVSRFPAGLVSVGDAVASFNPVYGQGMSSAAAHALCLADALSSGRLPNEPARDYFSAVRRVVDDAWQTSVLNDLRLPHVAAERPFGFALATRLGDLVHRATVTDPVVGLRFLHVLHMIAPPRTLMTPATIARSLRASRDSRRGD
ncbi:FAD-dependent oxidoreductase [Yinghuangia sp. YIM S09857]|uniref:FAD-dependent oxidoreductase n=1 Tax=Yinghuangia sp. YIM S09857 TaxID=3436929 RepID=UPI003F52A0E4